MRKERQLIPETYWFVTTRCSDGVQLLRPDAECESIVAYWLGRALSAQPGIQLLAAVQMSNHLHLVVRDDDSSLSRFMAHFLGQTARAVNRLRNRRGPMLERRFTSAPILDREALTDRIVYCALNPVAANLVRSPKEWPGLCLWEAGSREVTWFDETRYRRDRLKNSRVTREKYTRRTTITISSDLGPSERATVATALGRRREKTNPRKVLGRAMVLSQSPYSRPGHLSRTPSPLCHTSCLELWFGFVKSFRDFRATFREASKLFRSGVTDAAFPKYSFKPGGVFVT